MQTRGGEGGGEGVQACHEGRHGNTEEQAPGRRSAHREIACLKGLYVGKSACKSVSRHVSRYM